MNRKSVAQPLVPPGEEKIIVQAWVVFSGQADRIWLRMLRPGFRHCYLVMNDGRCWFSLDPMLNHMELAIHHHIPATFDLPGWLAGQGHGAVVPATLCRTRSTPAPWRIFTCVEAVKRTLGIHARLIFTPWQLYRFLCRQAAKKHRAKQRTT